MSGVSKGTPVPLVQFSVLVDGVFCGGLTILHLHPLNQTTQKNVVWKTPNQDLEILEHYCGHLSLVDKLQTLPKEKNFPGPSGRAFCWDQTRP